MNWESEDIQVRTIHLACNHLVQLSFRVLRLTDPAGIKNLNVRLSTNSENMSNGLLGVLISMYEFL